MTFANNQTQLIGNTPILKIESLSQLTGCEIFLKCESLNPGGTIKDRAAKNMVEKAIARGDLKPGMTIVEGTAGNTGIGLALVGKALGYNVQIIMPEGQAREKEKMIELFGAELRLAPVVPFKDENHFYHTARKIGESSSQFWWANQFENEDNYLAHYEYTGPEISHQFNNDLDFFVCSAGTGGTIGGVTKYLKEKISKIKCYLVDPKGSGLHSFIQTGTFQSEGTSITEGIGIMRETKNFHQSQLDGSFSIDDATHVSLARYVRDQDGVILGTSSSLNLCAAYKLALENKNSGKKILTFMCEQGERGASKMFDNDFLNEKSINAFRTLDQISSHLLSLDH